MKSDAALTVRYHIVFDHIRVDFDGAVPGVTLPRPGDRVGFIGIKGIDELGRVSKAIDEDGRVSDRLVTFIGSGDQARCLVDYKILPDPVCRVDEAPPKIANADAADDDEDDADEDDDEDAALTKAERTAREFGALMHKALTPYWGDEKARKFGDTMRGFMKPSPVDALVRKIRDEVTDAAAAD
jgi:hypothetical protein